MLSVSVVCVAFRVASSGPEVLLSVDGGLPGVDEVGQLEGAVPIGLVEGRLAFASGPHAPLHGSWHPLDALPPMGSADTEIVRRGRAALAGLLPRRPICSVVGCKDSSRRFSSEVAERAFMTGRLAAEAGYVVLSGGLSGVMSEAARGARSVGGRTVGILPGDDPTAANPHIEVVLPSGLGYARNYLVALGSDVMIALPGGRGTLEEMCFALDFSRAVVSWGGPTLDGVRQLGALEQVEEFLQNDFWSRFSKTEGESKCKATT